MGPSNRPGRQAESLPLPECVCMPRECWPWADTAVSKAKATEAKTVDFIESSLRKRSRQYTLEAESSSVGRWRSRRGETWFSEYDLTSPSCQGLEGAHPRSALSRKDLNMPRSKGMVIGFWIATALFCLQIGFTAYAQLRLPQVAEAFTHLGFPAYFRVELSWAKFLGVVLLLAPVPARLKEWAYAGFAINLGSALIAHLSLGDGPDAWGWAAATSVLWALSYLLWRRLQAAPGERRAARIASPLQGAP